VSDFWQDIKRTGGKVISLPPVLFIFSHTLFPLTLFGKTDTGMPKNHPAPNGKPIFKSQENGIRISGECNYTIIQIVIKKLYFNKKTPAFHVWDKRNTVSDIHGKGQLAPFHSKLAFMPLPFSGFSIPGEAHANTIF
jgi:hypothetical protein